MRIGAATGIGAALVAVGLGTAMLSRAPAPPAATGPTAEHITVSGPPIPLSSPQIAGLLNRAPDFGPLADPRRRASCLSGLGYQSSVPVLGAQPVQIGERPGELLVLAADGPRDLIALVVGPNCNSADTGLIADTQIPRS